MPVFYAPWGGAPGEIVELLVDSLKSNFPYHSLNWGEMAKTLGMLNAPLEALKSLLDMQQTRFPEQMIDWGIVLDESVVRRDDHDHGASVCGFW